MLGDEANLARGRAARVDHQMRLDLPLDSQRPHQAGARFILADHADEDAARPERGQVARHIAATADDKLAARHRQHRRRRLRRDAGDLAIDEIIEHQVADAQNGSLVQPHDLLIDGVHRRVPDASAVAVRTVEKPCDVAILTAGSSSVKGNV